MIIELDYPDDADDTDPDLVEDLDTAHMGEESPKRLAMALSKLVDLYEATVAHDRA
jgi:hypothetical protein